jgi:hypothetical protein
MTHTPRFSPLVFSIVLVACASAACSAGTRTERYDLPDIDLSTIGNELVLDYLFPAIPAEIVRTRFNLTFETETPGGSFDAAKIGLILQPPIDDPLDPDDRVLTLFQTGADFGWSGAGTFTFTGETDELNGPILPAPPGTSAMLYGLTLFHADRLTDPNSFAPLGGQFVDSHVEVDYIVIPEPATQFMAIVFCGVLAAGAVVKPRTTRHHC